MLTLVDKQGRAASAICADDCETLLSAFARAGASARERDRGAALVRGYQQRNLWLRCSCLGEGEPAPVLVPVAEAFIRRDPNHPEHAETCPFESDAADRERLTRSMRLHAPGDGFRLARAIAGAHDDDVPRATPAGADRARSRSRLAQPLFKLIADMGVHRVGGGPRAPGQQIQALHAASRGISLGGELRLSGVLELDPAKIDGLIGRIKARPSWPRGRRPHRVLVFIAAWIEGADLVAAFGARVAVAGPIDVFGPGRGANRHGPFLAAVLIASPDGMAPLMPLRAYAHPCWSGSDMLPLDSAHERRCLDILVRFQAWMAGQGHVVAIIKPLYDRSAYDLGRTELDRIVKPDFEGTIHTATGAWVRSFVMECKGFEHAEYRASKAWLEAVIKARHADYLEHRAYDPRRIEEHDRAFARDLARLGGWAVNKSGTLGLRPASIPPPSPAGEGGGLRDAGPASGPGRGEAAATSRPPARTARQAMRALIRHARRRAPITPP